MRGSVRIARIFGIPIRIHWSFSLLVLLVAFSDHGAPTSVFVASTLWIVALFASVTAHELSHCFVARRHGLEVRDIVLLPIGGVSQIAAMDGAPAVERDVAIAGPLASIGLAVAFGLATVATGGHIWPPTLFAGSWFARLAWLNLLLAAFNLVPALPMDGGRVLRAILAGRSDDVRATRIASRVAQVLGAVMIGVGIRFDWWLVMIGLFVLLGATSEQRAATARATLRNLHVGDLMANDPTAVPAGVSVHEVAQWLGAFPGRALPVTDGFAVVGVVAIEDLLAANPWSPVGAYCDRVAPVLDASGPAFPAVVAAFAGTPRQQLAVTYLGHPVGVLYRATVEQLAPQVQTAPSSGPGYRAA